jgi:hypothetical protein
MSSSQDNQEQPEAARSSHEQPGAARSSQDNQEQPEAARSSQEQPGAARTTRVPTAFVVLVAFAVPTTRSGAARAILVPRPTKDVAPMGSNTLAIRPRGILGPHIAN